MGPAWGFRLRVQVKLESCCGHEGAPLEKQGKEALGRACAHGLFSTGWGWGVVSVRPRPPPRPLNAPVCMAKRGALSSPHNHSSV